MIEKLVGCQARALGIIYHIKRNTSLRKQTAASGEGTVWISVWYASVTPAVGDMELFLNQTPVAQTCQDNNDLS